MRHSLDELLRLAELACRRKNRQVAFYALLDYAERRQGGEREPHMKMGDKIRVGDDAWDFVRNLYEMKFDRGYGGPVPHAYHRATVEDYAVFSEDH